jgi:glycosyltransferase involved in cell wall biosynthesis
MHILLCEKSKLPAIAYGGTERVVWWLAKALVNQGHQVSLLCGKGSHCSFARVLVWQDDKSLNDQIPDDIDIVHIHFPYQEPVRKPHLFTVHGNSGGEQQFHPNSVFVSRNHALRHGSSVYVHNGIDPDDYPAINVNTDNYLHFLGHAAWKVKNLKGAIKVSGLAGEKLVVGGGNRLDFSMGIKFFPQWHVRFKGMVGGIEKLKLMAGSKGLIFPVRWHEPFGLAIIESMVYGNPVFGTPYGSLPELIPDWAGKLSTQSSELAVAVTHANDYPRATIRQWALEQFNANQMALAYIKLYEKILQGSPLHPQAPHCTSSQISLLPWS